jgi:hypothetical protein
MAMASENGGIENGNINNKRKWRNGGMKAA